MHRRAALVLALLLSLSGCSTLFGGATTPEPTPATPHPPTPAETPTSTPAPYPPGYTADGVANASRALGAHVEALSAAESFTITNRAAVVAPNGTTNVTFVEAVDLAAERAFVETKVTGYGSQTRLYTDGAVYARNDPREGNTTYASRNATFTPARFVGAATVEAVFADAEWTPAEGTTVDGERAFVYTPTNLTATERLLAPGVAREDVTAFEGRLVVTESGVVHEVRYRATVEAGGEPRTYEVHLVVDALGETTVRTPGWVEREVEE